MHSGNVLRAIQRVLRCSGSAVGLAVAICFALSAGLGLSLAGVASAQDASHAGVVVQFDDHAQRVRSVVFTDTISGIRALELSGLDVVTTATSFGPTVCAIEGVGCPADDCFCNPSQAASRKFFLFKQPHVVRRTPDAEFRMAVANGMNVCRAVIVRIHTMR